MWAGDLLPGTKPTALPSGFGVREMKRYIALCLEGEPSIPARKEILARKREALLAEMAALQASVDYIDGKQQFYDDVLAGRTPYVSNLLPLTQHEAR